MTAVRRLIPQSWKLAYAEVRHRLAWRRLPVARPTRRFTRHHGLAVGGGPFVGMVYPRSAVGVAEQLVPKLLGAYERELHSALSRVLTRSYERVLDIGAADGYYAVGFARALPGCMVHAYEMNPLPAQVCRQVARANGVDGRVMVHGECRLEDLRELGGGSTLVFSDCEGCESELLDPAAVPLLRHSAVVVELHESLAPGVEQELPERFATTHTIELVPQELRHSGSYPALNSAPGLSFVDRELLVSEFRPEPVSWAVMIPRDAP